MVIGLVGMRCLVSRDLRRLGVEVFVGSLAPTLDALLLDPFPAWRLGSTAFGLSMVWLGVALTRRSDLLPVADTRSAAAT